MTNRCVNLKKSFDQHSSPTEETWSCELTCEARLRMILRKLHHVEGIMKSLKRKNFLIDEGALKKAKRILKAKTESDAVRQAISLVAFRKAVMQGYDRAAGKYPDFGATDRE